MDLPLPALQIIQQRLPLLLALYHFGSTAPRSKSIPGSESDVDLAVLDQNPIPAQALFDLKLELEQILRRSVDLVDLRRADSVITHQILETGSLILNLFPKGVALFETTAMAKYCSLNEERRDILEDIKKWGSVYGR